jgi:YfiH family protein
MIPFTSKAFSIFSDRYDGDMSVNSAGYAEATRRFLMRNNLDPENYVRAGLIHSPNVSRVGKIVRNGIVRDADGLVTKDRGLALIVGAGDCPPLYLHDPVVGAIGIAHCGWRGIASGIVEAAVGNMMSHFNSKPSDIEAKIGPGIQVCHYEVGPDVYERFGISGASGKLHISLPEIIKSRLTEMGVRNISTSTECTYHEVDEDGHKYFSFRREKKTPPAVQIAAIVLNP